MKCTVATTYYAALEFTYICCSSLHGVQYEAPSPETQFALTISSNDILKYLFEQ